VVLLLKSIPQSRNLNSAVYRGVEAVEKSRQSIIFC
jgi:hypothetical protein